MGTEKAIDFWKSNRDFDMILITKDKKIFYTSSLDQKISILYDFSEKIRIWLTIEFLFWINKLNKREEKGSGNRVIRNDGKQFLKKIAQSDTLLRTIASLSTELTRFFW